MLEEKIDRLIQAVEALTEAMTAARPTEVTDAPAPALEVKVAAPDVETPKADAPSAQDLKDATLKAARAGHKDAIRSKLDGFGVTKIQDLGSADAAEFYGWVIGLGAAK
jgi:hypothetical protein